MVRGGFRGNLNNSGQAVRKCLLALVFMIFGANAAADQAARPIFVVPVGSQFDTAHAGNLKAGASLPTTTTIVSLSPTPSVVGERITVIVQVNSAQGSAPGVVLVSDGFGNQCSITLPSTFGCTLTPMETGSRAILASYQPATGYLPSSATVNHDVGLPDPPPLEMPNLDLFSAGIVQALARLPDGGLLVGGQFSHVGGLPRQNLARLHPDGSLDVNWTSGCNGAIRDIAVDSGGAIYVAGFFSACAGSSRRIVAKLQPNGVIDAAWNAFDAVQQNGAVVNDVAVDAQGAVYVAGFLLRTQGSAQPVGLVKLSGTSGVVDVGWPVLPSLYYSVAIDDRHAYVYGLEITKRDRQSGLALPFNPPSISIPNGLFRHIALDPVGRLLVTGNVSGIVSRNGVVRLQPNGDVDAAWDSGLSETVGCGWPLVDGDAVLIGCAGPDGRARMLRMRADGSVDPGYAAEGYGSVRALARFGHGIAAGGTLSGWGRQLRAGLAVLGPTGDPLPAPEVEQVGGTISKMIATPDGGAIIGGAFTRSSARRVGSLLRLTPSGELDAAFTAGVNGQVFSMALDDAGSLFVGGRFSFVNGERRDNLAKVTNNGLTVDPFTATPDGVINAIALQGDEVLIGGSFRTVSQQPRASLAKLNADGSVIASWNPLLSTTSPSGQPLVASILPTEGGVVIGGLFDAVAGQPRVGLAKLDATGALITSWRADLGGAGSNTRALTLEQGSDQSVYVGGIFRSIGLQPRDNIARLLVNGEVAAWNPSANNSVRSILVRGTDVFLGGEFSLVNGLGRAGIAQVSAITGSATSFNPSVVGVATLSRLGSTTLLAGGAIARSGIQPRTGLAAFDMGRGEVIFLNDFERP